MSRIASASSLPALLVLSLVACAPASGGGGRGKPPDFAQVSARAWSFKKAPTIPNPANQIAPTASNGWTITSYATNELCFEGTYTSVDRPVFENLLDADVAIWNAFDQPEESVRATPARSTVLAKSGPTDALCDGDRHGVDRGVPCRLFSTQMRVCAPQVALATATGRYIRLTVAVAASTGGQGQRTHAVWHVQ